MYILLCLTKNSEEITVEIKDLKYGNLNVLAISELNLVVFHYWQLLFAEARSVCFNTLVKLNYFGLYLTNL